MNDIAKEHTRMQLASIHHLEQLKAEIRGHMARQADDSDRAQILIRKPGKLAQEGRKVANEERILKSLEFDEWKRRFNDVHKAHTHTFNWILKDSKDPAILRTGFKHWLRNQDSIYRNLWEGRVGDVHSYEISCPQPKR